MEQVRMTSRCGKSSKTRKFRSKVGTLRNLGADGFIFSFGAGAVFLTGALTGWEGRGTPDLEPPGFPPGLL